MIALPMYAPGPVAFETFWTVLRAALRRQGLDDVPDDLTSPDDLLAHWLDPRLLLSQSCGYPFVTDLKGTVQLVGTPRYAAEGCEGPRYRSVVVVRAADPAGSLAELRGRRAAINMVGSQSGWNVLRAMVAPLAQQDRFFASVMATGSHHGSMQAVGADKADVAAIDGVTFALALRERPDLTAPLRVLAKTASAPGLPFITSRHTSPDDLRRLRAALSEACADPRARLSLIAGFEVLDATSYDEILAMEAEAKARAYPALI